MPTRNFSFMLRDGDRGHEPAAAGRDDEPESDNGAAPVVDDEPDPIIGRAEAEEDEPENDVGAGDDGEADSMNFHVLGGEPSPRPAPEADEGGDAGGDGDDGGGGDGGGDNDGNPGLSVFYIPEGLEDKLGKGLDHVDEGTPPAPAEMTGDGGGGASNNSNAGAGLSVYYIPDELDSPTEAEEGPASEAEEGGGSQQLPQADEGGTQAQAQKADPSLEEEHEKEFLENSVHEALATPSPTADALSPPPTPSPTVPPTSAVSADSLGGSGSTPSGAATSPTVAPTTHLQSVHLTLKNYADHLKQLEDLAKLDTAHLHAKVSDEKNAQNRKEDAPIRWDPPPFWEEVEDRAPRVPGQEDAEAGKGKVYCKSNNGKFGAKNGGVILRYQYELTVDVRKMEGLEGDVVPDLEGGISDILLPVFFDDECLAFDPERNSAVGEERRLAAGGRGYHEFNVPVEERPMLRGGTRKLSNVRVVGIDSDPKDFPLEKECKYPLPNANSQCSSMEGALTLYFPPNYSIATQVQGAQFTTLNVIREGMAYGHIARYSHPAILKLKLLDDSYNMRPIIPPELRVANEDEDKGGGKGGVVAGILIPLLLLCCCGCCFWQWRRTGGKLEDLQEQLREMALPIVDPKGKRAAGDGSDDEEDSLQKPKSNKKKKSKKGGSKKKKKGKKKKSRSVDGNDTDDEEEDDDDELNPNAEQLMEDLMTSAQLNAVGRDGIKDLMALNAVGSDGSKTSSKRRRKKKGKGKKKKRRGKDSGTDDDTDEDEEDSSKRSSRKSSKKKKKDSARERTGGRMRGSGSSMRNSQTSLGSQRNVRSSQTSGPRRRASLDSQASGPRRRASMDSQFSRSSGGGYRFRRERSARSDDFNNSLTTDTDTDDNTYSSNTNDNGTTTSSDSTTNHSSTSTDDSDSDTSRSSTTSSDRGSTTEGSTSSTQGSSFRSSKHTHSTSTSDEDNNSTTTSTSDNSNSSDSSDDSNDSEAEDQFDVRFSAGGGYSSQSQFMNHRRNVRQQGRQAAAARGGRQKKSKPKTNTNSNLVIGGHVDDVDDCSVMTGMTGATGMHSLSSVATAQVKNRNARPIPFSIGGGGDDSSVMTGVSAATQQVNNRARPSFGVVGGGGGVSDDMSVMTGVSAATQQVTNRGRPGVVGANVRNDDSSSVDMSVMTGMSASTQQVNNINGGRANTPQGHYGSSEDMSSEATGVTRPAYDDVPGAGMHFGSSSHLGSSEDMDMSEATGATGRFSASTQQVTNVGEAPGIDSSGEF